MNVADVIGFSFILVGLIGVSFVVYVVVGNKLRKNYFVHYENLAGVHGYVEVEACSRVGAVKKAALLEPEIYRITKVVRQVGE